jgi:hypothetical protein
MATKGSLYNGLDFPRYVFADTVKSYIFLDFDAVFADEGFWKMMKEYLQTERINSIIVKNLDPDYHFVEKIDVANLPNSFIGLACNANLEGYFDFKATLHMITIKTLIYSIEEDVFCILLDRNYSIGILGFTSPDQQSLFEEYGIKDVFDYLKINFAGKELPNDLKDELHKNWDL